MTEDVIIEDLSNEALAEDFLTLKERIAEESKQLGLLEMTISQRMTQPGAKSLPSADYDIRSIRGSRPYYS